MIPEKGKGEEGGLCWKKKKFIKGSFYLHESSGKGSKAAVDEVSHRIKRDHHRTKPFFPVVPVRAYDGGNGIFIKELLRIKDGAVAGLRFVALDESSLDLERNLRIRDNGRKKEGMGMSAGVAENTGNAKGDNLFWQPDFACITAVPNQASGAAAGTGQLDKFNRKNDVII